MKHIWAMNQRRSCDIAAFHLFHSSDLKWARRDTQGQIHSYTPGTFLQGHLHSLKLCK